MKKAAAYLTGAVAATMLSVAANAAELPGEYSMQSTSSVPAFVQEMDETDFFCLWIRIGSVQIGVGVDCSS